MTPKNENEIRDDSPSASLIGIGIPALVIAAAATAYFLIPGSDNQFSQTEITPPAGTKQDAPKLNPDQITIAPESERKAPPAAKPSPTKDRDPRVDSQNSN